MEIGTEGWPKKSESPSRDWRTLQNPKPLNSCKNRGIVKQKNHIGKHFF